jgi:carboxypeptidase Taq
LIDDDLPVEALPTVWNDAMKRHLGIVPATDTEGVLQDIHWSGGSFGYFPTYVLGNLYAAQWLRQIEVEQPTLWEEMALGNLQPLRKWLHDKIHQMGRRYSPGELILRLTGEPLNPDYFIQSLKAKLAGVYRLD